MEKYKLRIVKDTQFVNCVYVTIYYFSVINSDIPTFPLNYIVNLPMHSLTTKTFIEAFPDVDRTQFVLSLLKDALENPDLEIKAEIEKRIKILSPKLLTVTCQGCGSKFSPKQKRSKYCVTCQEAYKLKFATNFSTFNPKQRNKIGYISPTVRELLENE
jgi:hypothetical protein